MKESEYCIITEDQNFLLEVSNVNEKLVTIERDGTVIIHKEGNDKKAAKLFYESLMIEGKTLHQKIKELEEELEICREYLEG